MVGNNLSKKLYNTNTNSKSFLRMRKHKDQPANGRPRILSISRLSVVAVGTILTAIKPSFEPTSLYLIPIRIFTNSVGSRMAIVSVPLTLVYCKFS